MTTSFPRWLLGFAVASSMLAAATAGASTRNYLTVEGQIFDRLGAPMPGTWVYCLGSRRASVKVDTAGRYRLQIPGATLEELDHTPLKIRIQARRPGMRFALWNGQPELGLDMRIVRDGALTRLRVASNDSSAVSAVANSVVLDASPRALLSAVFVGTPGAVYDTPPVGLDESDEIMLAGGVLADTDDGDAAKPRPPGAEPAARAAPSAVPPSAQAGPMALDAKPTPSSAPAATQPPVASAPAAPASSAAPPARTPAVSTPTAVTSPATPPASGSAPAPAPAAPSGGTRKWNAAGSGRRDDRPRVIRPALGDAAPEASKKSKRGKKHDAEPLPPPQYATSVTSTDAANPAPAPSPPPPTVTPVTSAPSTSTLDPSRSYVRTPSGPAADPTLHPVLLRDLQAERVEPGAPPAAQRVTTLPGRDAASASGADAPTCDCTIRGTVEVQWERPLTSRTEVVIAIDDAQDVKTSAELFMGSPRAFEIHPAPCGTHRLSLWTRSKQRFVLTSEEPRVTCAPGGVQQLRLILEPVARWGAPQQ